MPIIRPLTFRLIALPMLALLLAIPSASHAQYRKAANRTRSAAKTAAPRPVLIQRPSSPTSTDVRERTIADLLYFPFACLPEDISTMEEAQRQLTDTFGTCENISLMPGLHASASYDYTYRGVPIGICYYDWFDQRQWYYFYFNFKQDADQFYADLASDIKQAGIPLTADKIYGGMSNRRHPVSVFKWVYVNPPVQVKETDTSNINRSDVVGMFTVELGVYKRTIR